MMKRILLIALILLDIYAVKAQDVKAKLSGTPVLDAISKDIEGSPYLLPNFAPGSFFMKKENTMVKNLQIKYNIFTETVSFKDETGKELVPGQTVTRFVIENNGKQQIYQRDFPPMEKWDGTAYYEVLNTQPGMPMLLKKHVKTLISRKEYNSSRVTDTYLDGTKYFVFDESGAMTKFKSDKKSILTYFPNKQAEITAYIAKNNIDLKDDGDLGKVFDYYISLK